MGLASAFKSLFNRESNVEKKESFNNQEQDQVTGNEYEISEEEKVVLAIAASIMAAGDNIESNFHISKIRRVG